MIMRNVPFHPSHVKLIVPQDHQQEDFDWALSEAGSASFNSFPVKNSAFTVMKDGVPVACYGVCPLTDNKAQAWSLISKDIGHHGLRFFLRRACAFLPHLPFRRVELHVHAGFDEGDRMAGIMGFQYEGTLRAWSERGDDYKLYSRINHGT